MPQDPDFSYTTAHSEMWPGAQPPQLALSPGLRHSFPPKDPKEKCVLVSVNVCVFECEPAR